MLTMVSFLLSVWLCKLLTVFNAIWDVESTILVNSQSSQRMQLRCPGYYCGIQVMEDKNFSSCGACPRGYRANNTMDETYNSVCVKCVGSPDQYDWLYLGFMAVLALVLHWICIDSSMRASALDLRLLGQQVQGEPNFSYKVLILHASALVEVCISAVVTLLLLEPMGSFAVHSCKIKHLSDWYTLLHNPSPQYQDTLHCTQEAVFPLYSMVFIFYAWCVIVLLLIRPWLVRFILTVPNPQQIQSWSTPQPLPRHGKATIYAALYFFPVLALIHAVLAGLVYYAFPYILIVLSLISSASHFASKEDQTIKGLILSTVSNVRNLIILLGHWLLHGYAIASITRFDDLLTLAWLLSLVPLPALFYIFTARFTDPNKMHNE